MTKQPIDLTAPDIRPIYFGLYRTGPKSQHFEKADINNMLSMNVVEL